jgi:hypothetical protein
MTAQASGRNDIAQFEKAAGTMAGMVVVAAAQMFVSEISVNQAMEQKGQSYPTGTAYDKTLKIRTKHLYDKVVAQSTIDQINRLTGNSKIAFDSILKATTSLILEQKGNLQQKCLTACEPIIASQGLTSSLMLKSLVYFALTKSSQKQV